jgi:hypothetical protein
MSDPVALYTVDPATSWLPPDEPAIRAAEIARQLYYQFYPTGLFDEEIKAETDIARIFLTKTLKDIQEDPETVALLEAAEPITEPPVPVPPEEPLVEEIQKRQREHPYPMVGHLPLDNFPARGVGVRQEKPEGLTQLPPLPTP